MQDILHRFPVKLASVEDHLKRLAGSPVAA
jgi:hypothetical protein